jgi:hypothetical protein
VDVAGTIGFTVQQVFVNGSIIGFFQAQGNLLGKGETTGRVYTGKDFSKQTFQFTPPFLQSGHFINHQLTAGDGEKLTLRDSYRYLFTADGQNLIISHENFSLVCK